MAAQSQAANNAATQSAASGQSSSASPSSSTQPDLASNQWDCASNPNGQLCQTCMANSSQQVCSQQPDPTGTSGFQNDGAATDAAASNFNVPDPTGGLGSSYYQQQNPYQQNPYAQQQQVAGVPNGGGGGVGGGGSGQGAQLGSQRSGGYAPPSGNRADIMQGERGGGFAGYGAGASGSTNEFNTASNFRRGAQARRPASASGGYLGMDLKRYLPGGKLDPGRQVGGMYRTNNEIMGQTADMFRHISDRIQERCRLGYLFDCR